MKTKLENGQKLTRQYRNVILSDENLRAAKRSEEGEESRIVRDVSVSSDEPYSRWYGTEILLHEAANIDLTRVKTGAAPLLYNHDRDAFAGKVMNPQLRDGKLYVDLKFSQNEQATQMLTDLRDGLLTECSIGYDVSKFEVDEDEETYTATRWILYEVSMVSIPADFTVGVGRDAQDEGRTIEILIREKSSQERENNVDVPPIESHKRETEPTPMEPSTPAAEPKGLTETEVTEREKVATERERARVKKINDYVGALKNEAWKKAAAEVAIKAIEEGKDFDTFRTEAINSFETAQEQIDTSASEQDQGIRSLGDRPNGQPRLTAGERFVKTKGIEQFVKESVEGRKSQSFRVHVGGSILAERGLGLAQRAGFNSSDLGAVNVTISQEMISLGVQRLTIADLMSGGVMTTAGFIYPVENSFDPFMDAAQMVAERALKPEWEPDITSARADAQVIAVMATVPKQFMADFGAFSSWLNSRGEYLLKIKLEQQLLYGDGIGSNLLGVTARPGIQARAYGTVGSETTPDALFRGNTDIETNAYFDPDGFAMHPYDFEQIRLLKDANGQYLGGGPFYAPYGNGTFLKYHTIWGLPCVVSKSVKQGKPIAGAWKMGAQWFLREGLQIETSTSHKDYFQRNLLAVLFEERMALAVYRPIAFLEHTGFPGRS